MFFFFFFVHLYIHENICIAILLSFCGRKRHREQKRVESNSVAALFMLHTSLF